MTRAKLQQVEPDRVAAAELIAQAGGHIVTIKEAGKRLDFDPAIESRVDHLRRTRHRVFYDGDEVSALELEGALTDAEAVVAAAAEAVDA